VRSRGHAEQRDPRGVDPELVRMGAHPAQAPSDVVERSRETVSGGEPVGDRDRRDTVLGEVQGVPRRLARVAAHPAAAVHEDHRGRRPGDLHRPVVIVAQGHPVGLGVHHVGAQFMNVGTLGDARNLARKGHGRMP
jgi:hypothetical protein